MFSTDFTHKNQFTSLVQVLYGVPKLTKCNKRLLDMSIHQLASLPTKMLLRSLYSDTISMHATLYMED